MTDWGSWLPLVAIAAIPGLLNILVASLDLDEKCRELPFFRPLRIPGVWLWALIQFLLPAGLFWGTFDLNARPAIDHILILQAILTGLGFVTILNSEIRIGAESLNLKAYLYEPLVKIAFWLIESDQKGKAANFWTDVKNELDTMGNLPAGLDYLEQYFTIVVDPQPDKNYAARLKDAVEMSDRPTQVRAIMSLLKEVNRKDLVYTLKRFGCTEQLLMTYFPHHFRRRSRK